MIDRRVLRFHEHVRFFHLPFPPGSRMESTLHPAISPGRAGKRTTESLLGPANSPCSSASLVRAEAGDQACVWFQVRCRQTRAVAFSLSRYRMRPSFVARKALCTLETLMRGRESSRSFHGITVGNRMRARSSKLGLRPPCWAAILPRRTRGSTRHLSTSSRRGGV